MLNARCLTRATLRVPKTPPSCRNITNKSRTQTRAAVHPYAQRRQQHFVRSIATVTTIWAAATAWQWYNGDRILREVHAEEPPQEQEPLEFEKPRRRALSKEDNRDIISSQHLQVKRSWENPGLYAWGSNSGKVAAPDSNEVFIKTPRRIPFFDGVLLRDVKLDRNCGAAIDEKGDLLQWGTAFSKDTTQPTKTLRGKNLVSLTISRDRIIALSASGAVYSVHVSQEEQKNGPKSSDSWIPFWGSSTNTSFRTHTPGSLGWNERVTDISSGLEHALLLTSKGRVFSFASGTQDYPSKGQLGVPGLTWETRPHGSFDQPHEIMTLRGFPITKIATGDFHSLVSDSGGRAFAFGDNSLGQLGFDYNPESAYIDAPSLLPTQKLYAGTAQTAAVTNVFAGGNTSFLTIDATKTATSEVPSPRDLGRVTADTFAFGYGVAGQLGTGRYVHIQSSPSKIPTLSGLFEYDEKNRSVIPIRLAYLSVGQTHASAVMDNVASISVSRFKDQKGVTENDTNWGQDIVFWGNNEFYQIGSGKRNNVATPAYIQPLDTAAEVGRDTLGLGRRAEREAHRFQITPRTKAKVNGRGVNLEQRVECGRAVTAVYSKV